MPGSPYFRGRCLLQRVEQTGRNCLLNIRTFPRLRHQNADLTIAVEIRVFCSLARCSGKLVRLGTKETWLTHRSLDENELPFDFAYCGVEPTTLAPNAN